jgi:hypothetical protein
MHSAGKPLFVWRLGAACLLWEEGAALLLGQWLLHECVSAMHNGRCVGRDAAVTAADPHSNQPLGLNQLYPNLVVRDMVERWLQTGEVADSTTAGASSSRLHSSHLQQLQLEGSEDPLSSFGASSSSGGSSSGSLSLGL